MFLFAVVQHRHAPHAFLVGCSMSLSRLCLLLLLPTPLTTTATILESAIVLVLPQGGHTLSKLGSQAVGNCAQCGLLCAQQEECLAVTCSDVAEKGVCQLLGDEMGICDTDWTEFNGACYIVLRERRIWSAAKAACRQLRAGSELASIHSQEENDFVKRNLLYGQSAFIGLEHTGPSTTRNFYWLDDTPFDFTHWRDGQPNDRAENDLCVVAQAGDVVWLDFIVAETMSLYPQLCKYTP
ncbi:C-type lectin lectoxin-Thr1-like [Amphibalanus amphitrite]|uniref:C-type lectin lectoxin-Thr1-like n=1 Tax=Amphibalanus amphitrite TaxID=1232801 RepID=UPI001C911977|nr:C-type lectin lectoxin-Thr1-like [Amphibalanus amphitrite]